MCQRSALTTRIRPPRRSRRSGGARRLHCPSRASVRALAVYMPARRRAANFLWYSAPDTLSDGGDMVAEGMSEPEIEATTRAQAYARHADLGPAVEALQVRRDDVLERWLEVVARQPFHRGRRDHAVADDVPSLFDAILAM